MSTQMPHLKSVAIDLVQEATDADLIELVIQLLLDHGGQETRNTLVLLGA